MYFTTSWDDGCKEDVRIAELLDRYNLKGTFYICKSTQKGDAMLSEQDVRSIAKNHEIGGHTLTHVNLTKINLDEAREEIVNGKEWIESITDTPCTTFCYPWGAHNASTRKLVREAGFTRARTVKQNQFSYDDPLTLPTTLQVYPYPWRPVCKNLRHRLDPLAPLRVKTFPLLSHGILPFHASWDSLSKAMFTHALQTQKPFFHIWGHSKELDRFNMWEEFEKFLEFVSKYREEITPVTNGELLNLEC